MNFEIDFRRLGFQTNFTLQEYLDWKNNQDIESFLNIIYKDFTVKNNRRIPLKNSQYNVEQLQKIGEGSFGAVYKTKDSKNVIKIIRTENQDFFKIFDEILIHFVVSQKLSSDPYVQKRQQNHVMARVPKLKRVGLKRDSSLFIMMEYLDTPLQNFVNISKTDDSQNIQMLEFGIIYYQICSLMIYLRDSFQFTHSDFKTNNVMIKYYQNNDTKKILSHEFDVYIIDFGFSSCVIDGVSFGTSKFIEGKDMIMLSFWMFYDFCNRFDENKPCKMNQLIYDFLYTIIHSSNIDISKFSQDTNMNIQMWRQLYDLLETKTGTNVKITYEWIRKISYFFIKTSLENIYAEQRLHNRIVEDSPEPINTYAFANSKKWTTFSKITDRIN